MSAFISAKTESIPAISSVNMTGACKSRAILPIYDLTPFTLLDFPERTACVVWFSGCNMRCLYCHNPEIVRGGSGRKSVSDILSFLERRKGLLDGVVFSGGEATLYKGIVDLARQVKSMGYALKLDTNGSRPERVQEMLEENLLDYIALDYKAPPPRCRTVTGRDLFAPFAQTLDLLCGVQSKIPFEVRTTVHADLMKPDDLCTIMEDLAQRGYRGTYYVQNYIPPEKGAVLGHLPPQSRTIPINSLPSPKGFTLAFRNF